MQDSDEKETKSEDEVIESLQEEYEETLGKQAPNNMKNNPAWLQKKINEANEDE